MKQTQHDGKGQSYKVVPPPSGGVTHAQTAHDGGRTTIKGGNSRSAQMNYKGGIGMKSGGHCKSQGQKSHTGCDGGY
jgi:hypothetical protein